MTDELLCAYQMDGGGTDTSTPASPPCPGCGKRHDVVVGPTGVRPRPMDLSVCSSCGAYLQFDEQLRTTALSDAAFAALAPDERLALEDARSTFLAFQATKVRE